jgi:hypothetical protein
LGILAGFCCCLGTDAIGTDAYIKAYINPIGTDAYIKGFVTQNNIKILKDFKKLDPLTDGFTHFQLVQENMNTCTQYMSANKTLSPQEQFLSVQHIHIDTVIEKFILQKGTRGSFHHWVQDDYDLAVTMLQKSHVLGGLGFTPNVLAQISDKVVMTSRQVQRMRRRKHLRSQPPKKQLQTMPSLPESIGRCY